MFSVGRQGKRSRRRSITRPSKRGGNDAAPRAPALAPLTALAFASVGISPAGLAQAADVVPPIGGGYAGGPNVVAIPVDDPDVKAIAGALFKPAGAGPFPAVVYMSGAAGLSAAQ